jgi:hypothetical protein
MNSDEINLDEEFPPDNPIGGNEPASLRAPVTEQIIIPNAYPTELARKVRKQDFTDGTVYRTVAQLMQEILASRSGRRLYGLSATQIGVNLQIMVVEVEKSEGVFEFTTFVNPAFITYSKQAVEWAGNCFTPDCGNTEPGPLCLDVIALDAEGGVMRLKNLISSNEGLQTQIRPTPSMA